MIGCIMKPNKGPDYKWVTDDNGQIILRQPFSIRKMLAETHVREALLKDKSGSTFGVKSICVRTIDGPYDHQ